MKGLLGEGLIARIFILSRRADGRMELVHPAFYKGKGFQDRGGGCGLSFCASGYEADVCQAESFYRTGPGLLFFEEEPFYCYMIGTARAAKETEEVSGDNFAFRSG